MGSHEAKHSLWTNTTFKLGWTGHSTVNDYHKVKLLSCIRMKRNVLRFLAAEFGLKGKNNLEGAQVDEVVDTIEDVIGVAIKTHFETDPVKKAETVSQLNTSTILPMLANIEKR